MVITPAPYPFKTEFERMVHELDNIRCRDRSLGHKILIDRGDLFVSRLVRLRSQVMRGEPLGKGDEVFIKELYDKFGDELEPHERVENPPEGHPAYWWPPGVEWRPMDDFLPEHQKSTYKP